MPKLVPAVGVGGVEVDGLAIGSESLSGIVQERQRADVTGRGSSFFERLRALGLAAFLDALKHGFGRPGLALGQQRERFIDSGRRIRLIAFV